MELLRRSVLNLLPVVVNKVSGREVFDQEKANDAAMKVARVVWRSTSHEQRASILALLDPEMRKTVEKMILKMDLDDASL